MKKILSREKVLLFCAVFFLLTFSLDAKPGAHQLYRYQNTTPGGWIVTASAIFSYVHYAAQPGALDVTFPYRLTTTSNGVTNKVFSSHNVNLTGTGKWVYPSVGLEIGKENFSVEAQMGWYVHYWSDNLYGGINYRFILHKVHEQPQQLVLGGVSVPGKRFVGGMGSFPVKISLGFFYYQPIWQLGTIDLSSQQFDALNYTMNSIDSASNGSGTLTVYYHQNILALKPSFSIGYAPIGGRIELSFTASPLLLLKETGGLRFYLNTGNAVDWQPRDGISLESVIPLDTYGLHATFNGEQLSSTPFHLKSVMYSFKIGFRFAN